MEEPEEKISKRKSAGIKQNVIQTAEEGSKYLLGVARGTIKKPSWHRIKVAQEAVDHALGKPATKVELPTGPDGRPIIPYSQIVIVSQGIVQLPDDNGDFMELPRERPRDERGRYLPSKVPEVEGDGESEEAEEEAVDS